MGGRSFLTTNLVGGLGNQLFLIANLLATAKRNDVTPVLPRATFSSSNEQPRPVYWTSIFSQLDAFGVERELPSGIGEVIVPEHRPATGVKVDGSAQCVYNMVGFFQSEIFFADYPIVREIIPPQLREAGMKHLHEQYGGGSLPGATHYVGLHVRRGDYLRLRDVFEILEVGYYDAAMRQLLGHALHQQTLGHRSVHVLIFCEEERDGKTLVGYFRSKYAGLEVSLVSPSVAVSLPSEDAAQLPREVLDLMMLSHCDDVVMANSSWSWWAAYLNNRPLRRVVAPSRWFRQFPYPQSNHLYCSDWMLL
ncbi:hypothetical protein TRVL_08325 [Trypanosoma vivax]|nr:hypothetical protein TRVL_08325 [Trypanosoma vivax]